MTRRVTCSHEALRELYPSDVGRGHGTAPALAAALRAMLPFITTAWAEATSPFVLREDRASLIAGLR